MTRPSRKHRLLVFVCVTLFVAVGVAPPARAWNAVGHMTVAKLAWDRLSVDEQTKLTSLLSEHPHYASLLSADCPAGTDVDVWTFMRSAVWPDLIRVPRRFNGDPEQHPVYRFHRGPWHYVNFPYVVGQSSDNLPAEPLPTETDILRQIARSQIFGGPTDAEDPDAEPEVTFEQNRAVRLCWLAHLVGDLHQPLHVATLIDEARLPGPEHDDQGGNLTAVRVEIGAYPTKLHAFWDQLPGTDNHIAAINRFVESLQLDPLLGRDALPELQAGLDVREWAAESYRAAKQYAYLEGKLPLAVWNEQRPPLPAVDDVPILPVGVEHDAREVARRRIVAAGERLSLALKPLLK